MIHSIFFPKLRRFAALTAGASLLAGLFFLPGCSTSSTKAPKKPLKKALPVSELAVLYFSDDTYSKLMPETRTVSVRSGDLPAVVIQELMHGPRSTQLKPTLPKEARLRAITVRNRVARPDFSAAIRNRPVGAAYAGTADVERMMVYSIVNTLGRVPGIDKVQILIEGRQTETLLGNIDISRPLSPDPKLISQRSAPAVPEVQTPAKKPVTPGIITPAQPSTGNTVRGSVKQQPRSSAQTPPTGSQESPSAGNQPEKNNTGEKVPASPAPAKKTAPNLDAAFQ
ncbi:MAG: GerMN domain-containing protein [Solirubrobacterales bacterium]